MDSTNAFRIGALSVSLAFPTSPVAAKAPVVTTHAGYPAGPAPLYQNPAHTLASRIDVSAVP